MSEVFSLDKAIWVQIIMSDVFSLAKARSVQIIMSEDLFSLAKAIPVQIVSTAITKAIQRITLKSFNCIGTKFLGLMTLDTFMDTWIQGFKIIRNITKHENKYFVGILKMVCPSHENFIGLKFRGLMTMDMFVDTCGICGFQIILNITKNVNKYFVGNVDCSTYENMRINVQRIIWFHSIQFSHTGCDLNQGYCLTVSYNYICICDHL